MPRGDRTGPAGAGPMTGRKSGFCSGYTVPGYMNPVSGTRGRRFRSFGFGRGNRYMFLAPGLPGWARNNMEYDYQGAGCKALNPEYGGNTVVMDSGIPPEQQIFVLKNRAKYMQESLDIIQQQIHELENREPE